MSQAAVIVYVEANTTPEQRVRLAADLAKRFDAQLVGLSALAILPPTVANGVVLAYPAEPDADSEDCGQVFRLIADTDSDRSRTAFR